MKEKYRNESDLVSYLKQYGTDLFMVLHQKQDNYHYHGLLCLNVCVKTFRKHLNNLLDSSIQCPKGMRPVSLSDKVDDANAYKAYCLYREGHPIKHIVVNDDLQELKSVWTKFQNNQKDKKSNLKLECDLHALQSLIPSGSSVRKIVGIIVKFYQENNRIIHIANCRQLAWTLFSKENPEALIDHILSDENLYLHDDHVHKVARQNMRQYLDDSGWCQAVQSRQVEQAEREAYYLKCSMA